MRIRSQLYLPADRIERLPRALASGAHGVILDLEDGVAPAAKDVARSALDSLTEADLDGDVAVSVRIDSASMDADVAAALDVGIRRLVLPKAERASLQRLDALLDGRPGGENCRVVALVESARGLFDALSLAEHPRSLGLALGEADLRADLGVTLGPDETELLSARSSIVAAAAAGGLGSPIGPVWTDIDDTEGLRLSSERLRRLGFGGRSAIHPSQIDTINDVFAPSPTEIEDARALIEAFDAAVADGRGAARGPDGSMIDEAVVRSARRVLDTGAHQG